MYYLFQYENIFAVLIIKNAMKKFTLFLLLLPNLFFANDLNSNENFEIVVVRNTKTIMFDSSYGSSNFSINMFQLYGNKKKKVSTRFNKKSKTLDLSETLPGTYVISAYNNKQYVDYLVKVFPDNIKIVDKKAVQNPIVNHLGKKMSIALLSDESKILVRFENFKNETIFVEYFTSEELNNKVFNLKNRYGKIKTTVEFDDKVFKSEFVL